MERDFLVVMNQGFYSTVCILAVEAIQRRKGSQLKRLQALPIPVVVAGYQSSGCSGVGLSNFLVSCDLCQGLGQLQAGPTR